MYDVRARKIKINSNINYLNDSLSRLKESKQKIEKSISKRRIVLANNEATIKAKNIIRDSLEMELSEIEKNTKHRK